MATIIIITCGISIIAGAIVQESRTPKVKCKQRQLNWS